MIVIMADCSFSDVSKVGRKLGISEYLKYIDTYVECLYNNI